MNIEYNIVGVENDVVSGHNIVANIGDSCMSSYRKFGLKANG